MSMASRPDQGPADRSEFIRELGLVRQRGLARVESANDRLQTLDLPLLRRIVADFAPRESFSAGLLRLVLEGVSKLPAGQIKDIAEVLFILKGDLYQTAPDAARKNAMKLIEGPYETGKGGDDFRKTTERDILGLLSSEMLATAQSALDERVRNGVRSEGLNGLDGDDQAVARSVIHLVRTLAARVPNSNQIIEIVIRKAVSDFEGFPQSGKPLTEVLASLDRASRIVMSGPLESFLGHISRGAKGPSSPPHLPHPNLMYPNGTSMSLVQGGYDPLTGLTVSPFFMCVYPVTQREWREFLEDYDWSDSAAWRSATDYTRPLTDLQQWNRPAVGINFFDCLGYMFWLWVTTSLRFRLPTESEWNLAAGSADRTKYPWGDQDNQTLNLHSRSKSIAVDQIPASGPNSLSGMCGNVWEYTSSLITDGEMSSEIEIPDIPTALIGPNWWTIDSRIDCTAENYQERVRISIKGGCFIGDSNSTTIETSAWSSMYNLGEYGGLRLAVSAVEVDGEFVPESSPFYVKRLRASLEQGRDATVDRYLRSKVEENAALAVVSGCGGGSSGRTIDSRFPR